MKNIMLVLVIFVATISSIYSDNFDDLVQKIKDAEKKYDLIALETIREQAKKQIDIVADKDSARYWFARACLGHCNIERFLRRELPKTDGKNITRDGTAEIAREAIEIITVAIDNKSKWAEAYRVRGELHSHTITGFMSGLNNGPKALSDVTKSLELDNQNYLAQIAQAKMFYYNPPISGGDVDKGIKTCKKAEKLGGGDRALTLLARCYIKKERPTRAVIYLRKALLLNPDNIEAKHFLNIALNKK